MDSLEMTIASDEIVGSPIVTDITLDFSNFDLDRAREGDIEVSREKLEDLDLVLKLGGYTYLPMAVANMPFIGPKTWTKVTGISEKLDLPLPLVFLKKYLKPAAIDELIKSIIDRNGECHNLVLTTGVGEVLDDKNPLNLFKLIKDIETRVNHGMGTEGWTFNGVIHFDSPNGYCATATEAIRKIKSQTNLPIIAGNIATAEGAKALRDAGADIVKVGIGPGSTCETRNVAGVGVPQITAAVECANSGVNSCVDGGLRDPIDLPKALATGAVLAMVGGKFGPTDAYDGAIYNSQNRKWKFWNGQKFHHVRGSASGSAHAETGKTHWLSLGENGEGQEAFVPFEGKGSAEKLITGMLRELIRYAYDGRQKFVVRYADILKNVTTDPTSVWGEVTYGKLLIIPRLPENPERAAVTRRDVAAKTTVKGYETAPLMLRPEVDVDDIITAIGAAARFSEEANQQLGRSSLTRDFPAGVSIPSGLSASDIDKISASLQDLSNKPFLCLEFKLIQEALCLSASDKSLMKNVQMVMLPPADRGILQKAISNIRGATESKRIIALKVENKEQYETALELGVDVIVVASKDERINIKLLGTRKDHVPIMVDGFDVTSNAGDMAKALCLGGQVVRISLPEGASEQEVYRVIRGKLAGLRSAFTFLGGEVTEAITDRLNQNWARLHLVSSGNHVSHPFKKYAPTL